MAGNSIGSVLVLTTFGESHGCCVGGVLDGYPAGIEIDYNHLQTELSRRRPGQSGLVSPRDEKDSVEFLSGIYQNRTLGSPIAFIIKNKDSRSAEYDNLKNLYRPSHSDYTYEKKYGTRDERGGGRSSARETAARVVAGALAKQFLKKHNIKINAFVKSIGEIEANKPYYELSLENTEKSPVRCPDNETSKKMVQYLEKLIEEGDSTGGVIECVVKGVKPGLGEPVYDKLHSALGKAMLSINAVKGFEYGSGFTGAKMKGSEHNDPFVLENDRIKTSTNNSGGIQGGISNGMDIYFRVAFKPTPTIRKEQTTIDNTGSSTKFSAKGRHDPCVVPRAVPIVEGMAAMVIMDHYLKKKSSDVNKVNV